MSIKLARSLDPATELAQFFDTHIHTAEAAPYCTCTRKQSEFRFRRKEFEVVFGASFQALDEKVGNFLAERSLTLEHTRARALPKLSQSQDPSDCEKSSRIKSLLRLLFFGAKFEMKTRSTNDCPRPKRLPQLVARNCLLFSRRLFSDLFRCLFVVDQTD